MYKEMDVNFSSQEIASMEDNDNDNIKYQNKNIVLPNCNELDWAQVIYAINYKRLLFINCYQTWSSFHNENYENACKYSDYTPEDLSHRFLQRVLPNIFEYELTENELYLTNLLDLHPNFERTHTGFKIVEQKESLLFPSAEAAIKTIMTTSNITNQYNFNGSDVVLNNQIITVGRKKENSLRDKFNFSSENAALLSVALCSNDELPKCEILPTDDVFKRLKDAKYQFEKNGRQPEHINISVDDLLKKMETLNKIGEAVTKLLNKSFYR